MRDHPPSANLVPIPKSTGLLRTGRVNTIRRTVTEEPFEFSAEL